MAFSAEAARVAEWVAKAKTVAGSRAARFAGRDAARATRVARSSGGEVIQGLALDYRGSRSGVAKRNFESSYRRPNLGNTRKRARVPAPSRAGVTKRRVTSDVSLHAKRASSNVVKRDRSVVTSAARGTTVGGVGKRTLNSSRLLPNNGGGYAVPRTRSAPRVLANKQVRSGPLLHLNSTPYARKGLSKKMKYGIAGGAVAVGTGLGIHQTNKSKGVTTSMPNGITDITTAP